MTWREVERDDRHRITIVVYRCRACGRLGTSSNPLLSMPQCVCQEKR